jgi:hypothetical protein
MQDARRYEPDVRADTVQLVWQSRMKSGASLSNMGLKANDIDHAAQSVCVGIRDSH